MHSEAMDIRKAAPPISVKAFVKLLVKEASGKATGMLPWYGPGNAEGTLLADGIHRENDGELLFLAGRKKGWLEEQDQVFRDRALNRKTAARMIHEFLRRVLEEEDSKEWQQAKTLQDLYDCHSCVNHIAQVYEKGIMEALEDGEKKIFGADKTVSDVEAKKIVERIFDEEKRVRRTDCDSAMQVPEAARINCKEALEILANKAEALLVDVRSREAYEKEHLPNAVNVPMADIIECPEKPFPTVPILLYCERGYLSRVAANCLADAGYDEVYYFGLEKGW